jgi:hypothetical protein
MIRINIIFVENAEKQKFPQEINVTYYIFYGLSELIRIHFYTKIYSDISAPLLRLFNKSKIQVN